MIRRATIADKTEIYYILAGTQSPWSLAGVSDALENSCNVTVVNEEGEIRAVLLMQLVADECEVLNFAVASEYRRQGIGEATLKEGIELCRSMGAGVFYLEVRRSNKAAISLYEKVGFKIVGGRKGYYQAPAEDALVLNL